MSSHLDPKVCPFLAQTGGPCPCMHPLGTGDEQWLFMERILHIWGKALSPALQGHFPLHLMVVLPQRTSFLL